MRQSLRLFTGACQGLQIAVHSARKNLLALAIGVHRDRFLGMFIYSGKANTHTTS